MSSKSYTQNFRRTGVAGNTQLGVTVYDVSNGDTLSFRGDLNRIDKATFIGISGRAPDITSVASTAWTSTTFTFPSTASLVADDVDLLFIGPGVAS